MPDLVIGYDPLQPVGERLPPEVIAEIQAVAPSTVLPGSITENKFADGAVSTRALGDGQVTSEKIGDGEVKTINLEDDAVTEQKLAPESVSPRTLAPGVPAFRDFAGNPITRTFVQCTLAEHAALASPDPSVYYMIES